MSYRNREAIPCKLCKRRFRTTKCRECDRPITKPVMICNSKVGLICTSCRNIVSGDIHDRESIYAIHHGYLSP